MLAAPESETRKTDDREHSTSNREVTSAEHSRRAIKFISSVPSKNEHLGLNSMKGHILLEIFGNALHFALHLDHM